MPEQESAATTDDAFLDGALHILQPAAGYRAGIDAVLLAAAVPAAADKPERALDVGAGVGTAGLCLARRSPLVSVTLFERETALASLARANVERNVLDCSVSVAAGDLATATAAELAALGLAADSFDHVLANPPFHATGDGTPSGDTIKAGANAMPAGGFETWARFIARFARPGGTATVIHKAEALAEVLAGLSGRFGALKVKPIHAREGEPAIRVIVQGIKASRAPLTLASPLVLHHEGNAFTHTSQMILRQGAALIF